MGECDIPKRCSVDDNHPLAQRLMVTLNGSVQHWVTAYDVTEGWVERYVTDRNGNLSMYSDEYRVERVVGVVMVFLV